MTDNKNQPAFPTIGQVSHNQDWLTEHGMTKREYFAAKALQGLLASWGQHDVTDFGELASDAVKAADALLTALESNKTTDK